MRIVRYRLLHIYEFFYLPLWVWPLLFPLALWSSLTAKDLWTFVKSQFEQLWLNLVGLARHWLSFHLERVFFNKIVRCDRAQLEGRLSVPEHTQSHPRFCAHGMWVVVSMYMTVFCNSRLYTSKLQGTWWSLVQHSILDVSEHIPYVYYEVWQCQYNMKHCLICFWLFLIVSHFFMEFAFLVSMLA